MKAICVWNINYNTPHSYSSKVNLDGYVLFTQLEKGVKVSFNLSGLDDGEYAVHIHENKVQSLDLENKDCCQELGGHFNVGDKWDIDNPFGTKHGHHTGDLCFNITFDNEKCEYTYIDERISLDKNKDECILDRYIVIHEDKDDMGCVLYPEEEIEKNVNKYVTGNSGGRIACAKVLTFPNKVFD